MLITWPRSRDTSYVGSCHPQGALVAVTNSRLMQ